jgi:hypothetical protein
MQHQKMDALKSHGVEMYVAPLKHTRSPEKSHGVELYMALKNARSIEKSLGIEMYAALKKNARAAPKYCYAHSFGSFGCNPEKSHIARIPSEQEQEIEFTLDEKVCVSCLKAWALKGLE